MEINIELEPVDLVKSSSVMVQYVLSFPFFLAARLIAVYRVDEELDYHQDSVSKVIKITSTAFLRVASRRDSSRQSFLPDASAYLLAHLR